MINIKKIFRKYKKKAIFAAALAAAFLVCAHLETYWVQVKTTAFTNRSLPMEFSGKKIAYISDVHCGEYFGPQRLAGIVAQINSLKPDIVLFGGDYVNRNGEYTARCFREYAKIAAPLGKFGVLGNHDIEAGKENVLKAMLAAGIIPLVNANRVLDINNRAITIAGTDATWYGKPDGAKAMQNATDFAIYLSHDPSYFEKYSDSRAKLLLAGHTHGGQVTIFGISLANLAHWHNYKYGKGIFVEPDRTVIVSNGIGATVLPLRFFARPQINLILLEK